MLWDKRDRSFTNPAIPGQPQFAQIIVKCKCNINVSDIIHKFVC